LTFPAVHQRSSKVSSHSHERNSTDGRVREPKPHDLGLQISCCVHSEMSAQDAGPRAAPVFGEVFRKLALQKESKVEEGHLMPDHVHMLPRSHRNMLCRRLSASSGQERDPSGQGRWRAQTQFRRATLLGPRIFREHGRARRGGDPRLHSQSREGRSEAGADEPLALIMPPSGGSKLNGPRQRPLLPLRAVHFPKAPGFAGGYLLHLLFERGDGLDDPLADLIRQYCFN
jgi:hypothetical protein